jgi:hypothetical protein
MKITPVASNSMPPMDMQGNISPSRVESVRSLTMKTNSTPLEAPPQEQVISQDNRNESTAPVEATQPLSPQLALLAKQRRALQVKERELSTREKALREQSGNATIDVARLKSEPLSVLLENGVTYEQLTEAIMANQGNSEVYALKKEIESLKQGIDQKFTERDTTAEKQVLAEMQREAQQLAQSDDYELVRETRSVPTVMNLIERTYRETGEVLDVQEALKLVEDELFRDAQRLAKSKKLQSQISPVTQLQPQQRPGMRTLTNRDTASVPMSAKQRALAAFYGNLKR